MSVKIAGCDLGKSMAKFVIGELFKDGELIIRDATTIVHNGKPMEAFCEWYKKKDISSCAAIGAVGLYSSELSEPVFSRLPKNICLETSLQLRPDLSGPLNMISVGASGYSILSRNIQGHISAIENEKCSSGTGETMVKIAGRFGRDIEEADQLANSATKNVPITARCSVFAKSEMTHFGNQGKSADQLFAGYFESVARYVAALFKRAQTEGPVYLIGGVSKNKSFKKSLEKCLGSEVVIDKDALLFEALGACRLAADHFSSENPAPLPPNPENLLNAGKRLFRTLTPAKEWKHNVVRLESPLSSEDALDEPVILGLDLGSTGSKAALTSIKTGKLLLDVYDRTYGNPVEAAKTLTTRLIERFKPDIRAIGATGSGREAVATVLRAAYPEAADRIVVINEIVAHADAAIFCDPDKGKSLSVVEIGGQDAKFIQISEGHIVESDMNKACSAGTGSFLEEQAFFYGVKDIKEFTDLAQKSTRPPDLGQMCTVFVAEAAAEANNQGFSTEDLFAGFQYSVIHNYINRVMGGRTFGKRIFFQGKPASGPSLAWTLAAVAEREVFVPHNPGAMGAWGIGLSAMKELGRESLEQAKSFNLKTFLKAEIIEESEFQCRDSKCENFCRITKSSIGVLGKPHTIYSGGSCPKYEISGLKKAKLPKDAPSAFDEHKALLKNYSKEQSGEITVGLLHVSGSYTLLPWLATFIRNLGAGLRVYSSDSKSLSQGEEYCYAFDSCAPVKIAHGVADKAAQDSDIDIILAPKFLSHACQGGAKNKTCPMEQALAEMTTNSLEARGRKVEVLKPTLDLGGGLTRLSVIRELIRVGRRLGADKFKVLTALKKAVAEQERYERELTVIGERVIKYGREQGIPVVVVCGSPHVIYDRAINANIPNILRRNGALAMPADCFPLSPDDSRFKDIELAYLNQTMRVGKAARQAGYVFPLLLSSFSCGPASFNEHLFEFLMKGYPHTTLESDGHGGEAGYVTRVQAFMHTARQYDGSPLPTPEDRLNILNPPPKKSIFQDKDVRLVMLSVSDRYPEVVAAIYRSLGFEATVSGTNSAEALALGRKDCSGKECLPYQLIWGSFRKFLEQNPTEKKTTLIQVAGAEASCRNCFFTIKDRIAIDSLGLSHKVSVRHIEAESTNQTAFLGKLWAGTLVWDILNQLRCYYRSIAQREDDVNKLYHDFCDKLNSIIERPPGKSAKMLYTQSRDWLKVLKLVDEISAAFAPFQNSEKINTKTRLALLTGDIYVRLDEFAADNIIRRLNKQGIQVIVDPISTWAEYFANEQSADMFGLPIHPVNNRLMMMVMEPIRKLIYNKMSDSHPWLPISDSKKLAEMYREKIDRYPIGEAPATLGSVLYNWREKFCDGLVIIAPWGCAPSLISESLLSRHTEIPMLFIYNDGTPIDQRRVDDFAFRLRRLPGRTAATQASDN